MKKKSTKQLINEMKTMLDTTGKRRLTVEGLVYGEDGDEMMGDEGQQPVGEPVPNGEGDEMRQQPQGNGSMPAAGEANPLDENPEITKLITNIRVETLQGLTALAETPESAQYELLKKIFLMIDKAVEDKIEEESGQPR